MQDGKGVVAQGTMGRLGSDHGRRAASEKLRAGRKVPAGLARARHGGGRRLWDAGRGAGGLAHGIAQIPGQLFQGAACGLNRFGRNVGTRVKRQSQGRDQAQRDQTQCAAVTCSQFFFHQGQVR